MKFKVAIFEVKIEKTSKVKALGIFDVGQGVEGNGNSSHGGKEIGEGRKKIGVPWVCV